MIWTCILNTAYVCNLHVLKYTWILHESIIATYSATTNHTQSLYKQENGDQWW